MRKIAYISAALILFLTGALLILSHHHDTSFLYELQTQVSRIYASYKYEKEANYAKYILRTIAENEKPPENWQELVGPLLNPHGDKSFYFFKIWLAESGTTIQDIDSSYPISAFEDNRKVSLDMRYGSQNPYIRFTFHQKKANQMNADLIFPLNNCLFDADYNNDDIYDFNDVVLARKQFTNR